MAAVTDRNKLTRSYSVLTPTWGNSKANGQLFYLRISPYAQDRTFYYGSGIWFSELK